MSNPQEEEKRKLAQKEAEDERKKKHVKEEYQREKVGFEKGENTWCPTIFDP